MIDPTDDLYRQDTEVNLYMAERQMHYIQYVAGKGDFIREESPGILQIRILKPKKDKHESTDIQPSDGKAASNS
jgi:hypothetical protein